MNLKSEIPVRYNDDIGWYAICDETLSPVIIQNLKDYVYKVNSQRLKGLTGEKRLRVFTALERLKTEELKIMTTGKEGITMFQSNQKVNPDRSFHFMGGH
jgi:hypothetical protein